MAHPHLLALALRPQPVEQQAVVEDIDKGPTELLMVAQSHSAAQFVAHRLHAVADPEHRNPEAEDDLGRARCGALGHRSGAAGQDDRPWSEVADRRAVNRIRVNLAIDPALAHPARDQLGHLTAEIEDQDAVGHGWRSKMATKKPSVPCRAGVSRRYCSPPGEAPPIVSLQACAIGSSAKPGSAPRKASVCSSSSSHSNEQVA